MLEKLYRSLKGTPNDPYNKGILKTLNCNTTEVLEELGKSEPPIRTPLALQDGFGSLGRASKRVLGCVYTYIHTFTLPYLTLHYIGLDYITLPYITFPYLTLQYITLHYIALRTYICL